MDGVDAALVRFDQNRIALVHALCEPYPESLRQRLGALADPAERVALQTLGELDVLVGRHFAAAADKLLEAAGIGSAQIRAIGSHGQTVGHYPSGDAPNTLQIGDPNTIAERTGLTTVADFRRRDMAAGGQGAPLVPAFHQHVLRSGDETRVVVNIGGIANLTVLEPRGEQVTAFDTGPGNGLLDAWVARHRQATLDEGGRWAAGGQVHPELLAHLLNDGYFRQPAPKSTGREYFNLHWLDAALRQATADDIPPRDVQATLAQLTAQTIADGVREHAPGAARLIICGGGAHNADLMARLAATAAPATVEDSGAHGVDPDWMEAMAFAWLAARRLAGQPGNLPAATGARKAVLLGAVYPGNLSK